MKITNQSCSCVYGQLDLRISHMADGFNVFAECYKLLLKFGNHVRAHISWIEMSKGINRGKI